MSRVAISLRERHSGRPERIDREKHIIHGVKICGRESTNGRTYSDAALSKLAKLCENGVSFVNHTKDDTETRKYGERLGRFKNATLKPDGVYGDLHYRVTQPVIEQLLDDAANDPSGVGFSINGSGTGRRVGGKTLVDDVTHLYSIDLVDGPGAVGGLFEQDTAMDPLAAPVDVAASGGGDFRSKLADLAAHCVKSPDMDKAEIKQKLLQIVQMLEADEPDDDEPDGDEPTDEVMTEQLRRFRSPAVRKACKILLRESRRQLASKKGLKSELVTVTFLEQLVSARTEADAVRLIEDRRVVAGGPRSSPADATIGGAHGRPDIKALAAEIFASD